ncbi:hypothetical protein [uncultured Tateyamaria sp.]|uniref:hypothetical protein n=1 Tax=uncultured Tateyamaria sp. TaxID=455651 RepID=UPI00262C8600|nr:hypothetical protein [uncultured Tateyamaria sp.]
MSSDPPPAIYCYSKSGHTRRAAEVFAQKTGAEIVPIEVDRYRIPLLWIVRAIWDVWRSRIPPLRTGNVVPAARPWIVVATPVWADQPAPPARSVLATLSLSPTAVGLLTTCGSSSDQLKCMQTCDAVLGHPLTGHANIPNEIENTDEMDKRLSRFANVMRTSASKGAA